MIMPKILIVRTSLKVEYYKLTIDRELLPKIGIGLKEIIRSFNNIDNNEQIN